MESRPSSDEALANATGPQAQPSPTTAEQAALAEQDTFFYHLAHDVRAPLRAINTFTGVVLEDYGAELNPEAKGLLEKVLAAAARMDRLMQNVVTFNRVTRQPPHLGPVDMEKLVREVCASPEVSSQAARIHVQGPLLRMRGDESFVRACVAQLLENALKFVSPGVEPSVTLTSEAGDGVVRFMVADKGIGIPEKGQERMFEMFQRLRSDYEGNGLGLAVVKRAMERMGGQVGVESEPGSGSRFWLELPKP